jgi:hypothetical protein
LPHATDELVRLDQVAAGLSLQKTGSAPFLYFTFREAGRLFRTSPCGPTTRA